MLPINLAIATIAIASFSHPTTAQIRLSSRSSAVSQSATAASTPPPPFYGCTAASIQGYWSFGDTGAIVIPNNPSQAYTTFNGVDACSPATLPYPVTLNATGWVGNGGTPPPGCCTSSLNVKFNGSCHAVRGIITESCNGNEAEAIGMWTGAYNGPLGCANPGQIWIASQNRCVYVDDVDQSGKDPQTCPSPPSFGDPIRPLTGTERLSVSTGIRLGREILTLTYDTSRFAPRASESPSASPMHAPSFGAAWFGTFHRRLAVQQGLGAVTASRGDGRIVTFKWGGGGAFDPDTLDRASGQDYIDALAQSYEKYGNSGFGQITQIDWAAGKNLVFTYSDANTAASIAPAPRYLIRVQDSFGREIRFTYALQTGGLPETDGKVKTMVDSSGLTTTIDYDVNGNLEAIRWPDNQIRRFVYENPNHRWALTGVIDEQNVRHATVSYDGQGRAINSQLAGGVDAYSVAYGSSPPQVGVTVVYDPNTDRATRYHSWQATTPPVVTLPDNTTTTLASVMVHGYPRVMSKSQPAGSGCGPSASSTAYDSVGNATSIDDFNGNRVCYAYDTSKRETVRVEGLPGGSGGASCPAVIAPGSLLPAGARKISSQWFSAWPLWRLPARVAEPGRIVSYVYNGQPDPLAGAGALASCAPASATVPPYNSPIVVLCRKVEQATTDVNGAQGSAAQAQPNVPLREEKWAYNADGQVVAHDGPRQDVADVTSYEYFAETSFVGPDPIAVGHTRGDLRRIVDAQGQVTSFDLYNKTGQLLQTTDPNGVATTFTYDARQRLTRWTVGGLATVVEYWPTGLLKRVIEPDGSWVLREYDGAHRLYKVTDTNGNSITYTLDPRGRPVAEEVRDPSSALRRQLGRSIDALGRVQQITGREFAQ